MARLLLRVLLILSLVTNGAAAPWAMAAMKHDGHAGHLAGDSEDAAALQGQLGSHAQHGDHGHHPAAVPEAADADDGCCDGMGCECGCVLPPMLARWMSNASAARWSLPPASQPVLRERIANAIPPFRPPAA